MKRSLFIRTILLPAIIIGFFAVSHADFAHAQSADIVAQDCQTIIKNSTPSDLGNPNSKPSQCKKYLLLLSQMAQDQKDLDAQKGQSASISGDIKTLSLKIDQAQRDIKAKNLAILQLGGQIKEKNNTIETLSEKIDKQKESLAQLIRKTNEIDQSSVVDVVLSSTTLSQFYSDLDSFDSIKSAVHDSVNQIRSVKKETQTQKDALAIRKNAATDAEVALEASKLRIQKNQIEKNQLLSVSKNKEKTIQQVLADRAAQAAKIRSALFNLRDSAAIPFGDAYNYALEVQKKTGVDPAFLLAIMTQESNLGNNVGSCLVVDIATGNGKGKNTGTLFEKVMAPSRGGDINRGDTVPFQSITSSLGKDWRTTPVSCPIGGTSYYIGRGYGGAMGPAQFIPSTWMLFDNRIKSILGVPVTNPWNAEDAFMASGLYLSDLGASTSPSSEIAAACKYYGSGGSSCTYGKQVIDKTINIQQNMIDPLNL